MKFKIHSPYIFRTLLQQGPYNGRPTIKRVLIVTPSSLVKNWHKEFRRWLGRERINVFTVDQVFFSKFLESATIHTDPFNSKIGLSSF